MGRYIVFKDVETKNTLLTFRAGSYPNSVGKILEESLSLKWDSETLYDIQAFKNATFSEINERIAVVKFDISLNLIKKDFNNFEFLEQIQEYEELLGVRGAFGTILELFETHRNEFLISYG